MSIIHVNKNATLGYTILTRATLDDTRLSWKARGLLSYLLSKPDHWQVSIRHLTAQSKRDGRSAVQSALQELQRYGYAKLRTIRGPGGRVMGKRWDIFEVPEPELDFPPVPA